MTSSTLAEQQRPQGNPVEESIQSESEGRLELAKTGTSDPAIADTLPLWREILFVGIISSAQFTTQAGLGQCLAILQVIGDTFKITNPGDLSWLIASYSLTVGTFILVAGRFGDLFGYKKMLVIGYFWFSLWSMVAGLAYYSNHVLFNFARTFQGIGPAIMLPNALAILGSTYAPGPRKHMVFAIFGATAPGGAITGAVFAGIFNLTLWPWTFWSFAITLACLAFGTILFVPDPPRKIRSHSHRRSWSETIAQLDFLGAVTGLVGLVLINFSWNQAGVVSWSAEPYLWVLLILGALSVGVFFYVEFKVSSTPLLPFDAFNSDVGFVLGAVACGWACFGIWVYYTWEFYIQLRHATPLQTAAWNAPLAVFGGIAAISTGFLLGKIGPAWVMTMALLAFLVGTIIIATAPIDQTFWAQAFVVGIVIPWGMDMSFPSATIVLSNAVKKEHQGIAASLVATVVNYSISMGLGFAGTVEANIEHGNRLKGYRGAWYLGIGLAGLGLLVCLLFLLKNYRKERQSKPKKTTTTTQKNSSPSRSVVRALAL